jgi:hypothetical protein
VIDVLSSYIGAREMGERERERQSEAIYRRRGKTKEKRDTFI